MAELKKYSSFEALKLASRSDNVGQSKEKIFSEFEAFLRQLRSEYSKNKNMNIDNGKQSNR